MLNDLIPFARLHKLQFTFDELINFELRDSKKLEELGLNDLESVSGGVSLKRIGIGVCSFAVLAGSCVSIVNINNRMSKQPSVTQSYENKIESEESKKFELEDKESIQPHYNESENEVSTEKEEYPKLKDKTSFQRSRDSNVSEKNKDRLRSSNKADEQNVSNRVEELPDTITQECSENEDSIDEYKKKIEELKKENLELKNQNEKINQDYKKTQNKLNYAKERFAALKQEYYKAKDQRSDLEKIINDGVDRLNAIRDKFSE